MDAPTCAWPHGCDKPAAKRNYKQRKYCDHHIDNGWRGHNPQATSDHPDWLPAKPLFDFVDGSGGFPDLWAPAGLDEGSPGATRERDRLGRNIARARRRGTMRYDIIDEICCRLLRLHPAEIYGDVWWIEDEAEEVAA